MHDHLGSTRGVFDAGKALLSDFEYTPYGTQYAQAGGIALPELPAAFTGMPFEAAAGMYAFPYRMYAPGLGRWLTRDPLGMVDGPNVYGYVRANPAERIDPTGQWWQYVLCPVFVGAIASIFATCYWSCPDKKEALRITPFFFDPIAGTTKTGETYTQWVNKGKDFDCVLSCFREGMYGTPGTGLAQVAAFVGGIYMEVMAVHSCTKIVSGAIMSQVRQQRWASGLGNKEAWDRASDMISGIITAAFEALKELLT